MTNLNSKDFNDFSHKRDKPARINTSFQWSFQMQYKNSLSRQLLLVYLILFLSIAKDYKSLYLFTQFRFYLYNLLIITVHMKLSILNNNNKKKQITSFLAIFIYFYSLSDQCFQREILMKTKVLQAICK